MFTRTMNKPSKKESEQIKELDLSRYSFVTKSCEELKKLGQKIFEEEIGCLILRKNNIGKTSIEQFTAFCQTLNKAKLRIWHIDFNQLNSPSFSISHWEVLINTLQTLPDLECLSLQYNDLNSLESKQFSAFLTLVAQSPKRCLITENKWEFDRWNEIICSNNNNKEEHEEHRTSLSP